jgi:hypothetical protein
MKLFSLVLCSFVLFVLSLSLSLFTCIHC